MTELPDFQAVESQQEQGDWCWAACAQMVLGYAGIEASQEEIVTRIHGDNEDGGLRVEAASRYEIYRALSPETEAEPFEQIWIAICEDVSEELDKLTEEKDDDVAPKDAVSNDGLEVSFDESVLIHDALDKLVPTYGVPLDQLLEDEPAVAGLRDRPDAKTGHVYVIVGADYCEPREIPAWLSGEQDPADDSVVNAVPGLFDTDLVRTALDGIAERTERITPDQASVRRAENLARRFGQSRYQVERVLLVDPYLEDDPATPDVDEMRVVLPFEEFLKRADFVTTREDAAKILTRWSELARLEHE